MPKIENSENFKHRKSIRLKDFDYSSIGSYFVTICTKNRENLFGEIEKPNDGIHENKMILNETGEIVEKCWFEISNYFKNVELRNFVIMPNHIHGIITIVKKDSANVGAIHELPLEENRLTRRTMLLPRIIGKFKMQSSKRINILRENAGSSIWQRNYYEHIIRNEKEFLEIAEYIDSNPANWSMDTENLEK